MLASVGVDGPTATLQEPMMKNEIKIGYQAFVADGGEEFGAVRQVMPNGDVVVYVENAGDFVVTSDAIEAVHSQKIIVRPSKLDARLREAIKHSHEAEEPGA